MMRQRLTLAIWTVAAATMAEPALAIPAFARRYRVECHFCHDVYPKLNALGQRFRERGFRLEHEEEFNVSKWARSVPVIVRAEGTRNFFEEGQDTTTGTIKGVSAGNLGKRFSYWVDDSITIQSGQDNVTHVKPDNAWLRYEVVSGGKLYAKAGRLELDLPFTQARTPHLFGYDIYIANTGFETDSIGQFQDGFEVGGDLPRDAHWSAAVVKGRNAPGAAELSDEAGKFEANVFLRLSKRIKRDRVGGFAYIGRTNLALTQRRVWEDNHLRIGGDAIAWIGPLNLYGVYMYGRNDNSFATKAQPLGTQEPLSIYGGFAQADYHVRDEVVLTLRLNQVSLGLPTPPGGQQNLTSLFPGIQVWILEHLKVSFEYGFQNKGRPGRGELQAEVAF